MSDPANPLKTYHQRQIDDQATPVRLYGENGGAPQVQLSGSRLVEQRTDSDASEGVLTFSENLEYVEIYNRDTENDGVFTVNGIPITVPAGEVWSDGVGGTAAATVTVASSESYIVSRYV